MEGLARSLARAVENALAAFIARTASGHFSGSWWLLAFFVSIVAFALTWFIARRVGVTAKWSLGASAVVAGLALLGVAEFQGGNESWMTEQLLQGRAGDAIRASLADPNSAKIEFTAVQFGPEATICGVLNARGRGGGYQGARPFAVRFEAGRSQPALYIERENDGLSFGVGPAGSRRGGGHRPRPGAVA